MPAIRFKVPDVVMVRVAKTGSTSIIHGLLGGRPNFGEVIYGHFPDEWMHLQSFAFVRNPFDRLVSCFHMFQQNEVKTEEEAKFRANLTIDHVMDVIEDPAVPLPKYLQTDYFPKLKLHALPMTDPFYNLNKVKDIYRFEEFGAAFLTLAKKLGFNWTGPIPHRIPAERDAYPKYFNSKQRARAESILKEDCRVFNYHF